MAGLIEDTLIDLFLADPRLDPVKVFIIGEPLQIAMHAFPIGIIFIQRQEPLREQTGVHNYNYVGYVAFETQIPLRFEIKNRRYEVESYTEVRQYANYASDVIERNEDLSDLVHPDDGERVLRILTQPKEYFPVDYQYALTNRAQAAFSIRTLKLRVVS